VFLYLDVKRNIVRSLPLAGNATPIRYEIGGRQYVVIYSTGGKAGRSGPSGGIYVAFALP